MPQPKSKRPKGYTKTPNEFYEDLLPQIKTLAELKITDFTFRQTLGWHRLLTDPVTLLELAERTGLSEPSVIAGLEAAFTRKSVTRIFDGEGYRLGYTGPGAKAILVKALKKAEPHTKNSLVLPLKIFKSLLSYKERDKESPKESSQRKKPANLALTFELTAERRQWIKENTPEVLIFADLEVSKMLDWCDRKNQKVLTAERPNTRKLIRTITETRFHNWMFKAVEFKRANPTVTPFPNKAAVNADHNREIMEGLRAMGGDN